MFRTKKGVTQVLLAHPGGPYFQNKDDGAWTIPKGEPDADEDLLLTAQREFKEETGITPEGAFVPKRSAAHRVRREVRLGRKRRLCARFPRLD